VNNKVLFGISAKKLSIVGCSYGVGVLVLCYTIAVLEGHVAIIPIISDCGVQAPEAYFFRFGMITSAVSLAINAYLVVGILDTIQFIDSLGLFVSTLGSIGLGGLASVNEKEDMRVHGIFAAIFFGGNLIYMTGVLFRFFPYYKQGVISAQSMVLKTCLTVIGGTCAGCFLYFNANGGNSVWYTQIAIVEWLGTLSIIFFVMSFSMEYSEYNMEVATVDVNNRKKKITETIQPQNVVLQIQNGSYPYVGYSPLVQSYGMEMQQVN